MVPADKARLYHGRELPATKPVPESTQGDYYDEALTMAACQPNVRAIFLFHVSDESDLNRWQSGLYYPDGTPKATLATVKETIDKIHAHTVDCTGFDTGLATADDGWILAGAAAPTSAKPARPFDPVAAWKLIATS